MKHDLRVLHVITRLIVGGAQENTVATVLGLQRKPGVSVRLIAGRSPATEGTLEGDFAELPGVFSSLPSLVRPIHPWFDILALRDLVKLIREDRPHIVHTHSGKAGILGRVAARRARVPLVVHTIHGPSFGRFQGSLPNFVFLRAERYAAGFTDQFISVADAMTRQYLAAGIASPDRFTTIWSGFDLEPFLTVEPDPILRARLGLAPDHFVIVKLARLAELKGHEDLLRLGKQLVHKLPHLKILLIGDGPLRSRFEAIASKLGIRDRVIFAGLVPPHRVPAFLALADLLVHLSLREGLPRALPQALAARKPIISYDCDGAPEICIDGETGFLVPPGDLSTFCDRVHRLATTPALRQQFGQRGRELVQSRFGVDEMVNAIHRLYVRLARKRGIDVLEPHDAIS